jgi:hypothetical protein
MALLVPNEKGYVSEGKIINGKFIKIKDERLMDKKWYGSLIR